MSESRASNLLQRLRKFVFGIKFLRLRREASTRSASGWDFEISLIKQNDSG